MKRDCSTCICKEGSCYPSTTIFDKDKTCKSYDPDYEGYIAELEKQIEKMKRCEICKHYRWESCNYHSNWVKQCKENGMKLFELKEIKENENI